MAACLVKIVYVSAIIFTRLLLPCWAEGTFEAGTGEYGTQRLGVARPMNTKVTPLSYFLQIVLAEM